MSAKTNKSQSITSDDLLRRTTLTVEEAGRALGVGRSAAYRAVHEGTIPHIKVGRKVMVPAAAVRRILMIDVPAEPADTATA